MKQTFRESVNTQLHFLSKGICIYASLNFLFNKITQTHSFDPHPNTVNCQVMVKRRQLREEILVSRKLSITQLPFSLAAGEPPALQELPQSAVAGWADRSLLTPPTGQRETDIFHLQTSVLHREALYFSLLIGKKLPESLFGHIPQMSYEFI